MDRPTPPPTMRWCVGAAAVLYEQALIALRGVLSAADEQHWLGWIDDDLTAWNVEGSTRHHLSAYGGMGSLNDLVLQRSPNEPDLVWLDAALDTLRHLAFRVAPFAERSPSALQQIAPGSSSTTLIGLSIAVCIECHRRYVSADSRHGAAAAAWCSAAVPSLVEASRGEEVAPRCLGRLAGDDRHVYLDTVDKAIAAEHLMPTIDNRTTGVPRCACGNPQLTTSTVAVL